MQGLGIVGIGSEGRVAEVYDANLGPQDPQKSQIQLQNEISRNSITRVNKVVLNDHSKAFTGVLFSVILFMNMAVSGWLVSQMTMGVGG